MPVVRVAAVPLRSIPGDKASNLAGIEASSHKAVQQGARLVCFPAMAVSGYWQTTEAASQAEILKLDNANPALVHPLGPSAEALAVLARRLKSHLAVGIIEDFDYYHLRNSVVFWGPRGCLGTAAQVHTPVGRHPTYVPAREYPVFQLGDITAGCLVGDDVYYPEVARALTLAGARLLIVSLANPVGPGRGSGRGRDQQMRKLLAVRALENGVAVIAVDAAGTVRNRVEKTSLRFSGLTGAFNPDGVAPPLTGEGRKAAMLLTDLTIPESPSARLRARRPRSYGALVRETPGEEIAGTRPRDWDAQGELIWSRLRDLGFFCVDLYTRRTPRWKRRNDAIVVTASSLPPLSGYRAIVLTRPCLARMRRQQALRLRAWVHAGGTLVLDGYCGRNADVLGPLVGIQGAMHREIHIPSYRDASRITVRMKPSVAADRVFTGMNSSHRSKVWGQVWLPGEGARVTARRLAHICTDAGDKRGPGLYSNKVGRGEVYAFAYSSAYSQLLLMQGRGTTDDLGGFPPRVEPDAPRDGDVNTWGDQVVTDAEDQFFPSADYHLIPLINILRTATPDHILVSPVPDGKECGVIFTGDSDRASAELLNAYAARLRAHGLRATQFVCRDGYDAQKLDPDCEYGVHPLFHETEQACFDTLVSYGFAPKKLVCGRRHCLIQYGLTETLERMADCGIRFVSNNWDFPYTETHSSAFLFGTAIPHQLYGWNGNRIGMVDVPQVFMDYPPILKCCQAAYRDTKRAHGVGAWNFHPQNQVLAEQVRAVEWLARQVTKDDAWCGTMGEYGEWYRHRDRLTLTCTRSGIETCGEPPRGLTILAPKKKLSISGGVCEARQTSVWYGRKYWVHVLEQRRFRE